MLRFILLSLLSVLSFNTMAQTNLNSTKILQIHSKILDEDREYWISMPENLDKYNGKLNVVWVLDPEINFNLITGTFQYLTNGRVPMVPKTVIVGIVNKDRTRDFTPSHVKNGADLTKQKGGDYSRTGGAEQFLKFINQELKPEIAQQLPNREMIHTLFGHSFGGLLGLYSFSKHPRIFNNYIIIDPSLWWDDNIIVKQLKEETRQNFDKKLYLSFAGAKKDEDHMSKVIETLKQRAKVEETHFPNENHGTVTLPSLYPAIKFIYLQ